MTHTASNNLDPKAVALGSILAPFDLDAIDMDMLMRGDMLGSTGAKVFAALEALASAPQPSGNPGELPAAASVADGWGREIEVLLDNCHWGEDIDIAAQHEAVMAIVRSVAAAPQPPHPVKLDDAMVERASEADALLNGVSWSALPPKTKFHKRKRMAEILTAALSHEAEGEAK